MEFILSKRMERVKPVLQSEENEMMNGGEGKQITFFSFLGFDNLMWNVGNCMQFLEWVWIC